MTKNHKPLPAESDFFREMVAVVDREFTLSLSFPEAFCLLGQVQLALRHPGNRGLAADLATRIARQIQEQISVSPAISVVAEAGWHPESDVPFGT